MTMLRRRRSTDFSTVLTTLKPGWAQADCNWTQPRRKSCGWAPSTNCSSSTSKTFRQGCWLSTWPGSGHWQWFNDIWPRHCSLSFGLLPAASATNDCAFWCKKTLIQSFVSCRLDYTVTHCCMASLAVWSNGCSRYRTRQHGSSLELVDVTTSLQCSDSFIGCL